jgi:ribonuclease HI
MDALPRLTIHTDGASRGNPGAAAYAFVIERDSEAPIEEAGCLGESTNNQAEYEALVRALRRALELGPQHRVDVHSDSELMVKQMNGVYRVKNADLLPLYEDARQLVKRFQGAVTFRHVRRELNSRADALCNEALDGKRPTTGRIVAEKPRPARPGSLRDEAVRCLREAVLAWAGGEDGPTPEEVWEQLRQLLERYGVKLSL